MIPFANWSVLTADFLIVLHLTLGGVTLAALLHLVNAKWRYEVRKVAVSLFGLYPLALLLLLVLLAAGSETFPWMAAGGAGEHHHLNGWHDRIFLWAREVGGMLLVGWLYRRFIRLQAVSERSEEDWQRFKFTANWIPVAHVIYGTMIAWDFEMTMMPSWHSSIYGMYHFVSNFGMTLSVIVVLLYWLNRGGALAEATHERIYNYFAQMMLAFTILWTYLYFAQYLTMWYGNLPHERNRIEGMMSTDLGTLWWSFLVLKFAIPFVLLVFTYFRHSPSSIYRIGVGILVGTWIERYTWIAGSHPPSAFEDAHVPMSSAFDIVVTVAVVGVGAWLIRRSLAANGATGPRAPAGEPVAA